MRPIYLLLTLVALMVVIHHLKEKPKASSLTDPILAKVDHPDGYSIVGIDISHHNGKINWKKVRKQGITFAYIKSTQGIMHTNGGYRHNYEQAKKAGLVAGFYHFFQYNKSGIDQALFFIDQAHYEPGDMPPMVDVEYSPPSTRRSTDKNEIARRIKEIRKFDSVIYEKLDVRPIIYANRESYNDLIKGNFPDNDLWICNITQDPIGDIDCQWKFWQYSINGNVRGIHGNVDLDVFFDSRKEFEDWLNSYD